MMWVNCQIHSEAEESSFVLMNYVVWGTLLCPFFEADMKLHYVIDMVDGDMLLWVNDWS
jgi:hypothetical protein